MPLLPPAGQAMLRSCSGPGAGYWLTALPTSASCTLRPALFQTALRRRLRMRLLLGPRRCPGRHCRSALDALGDHLASCSRSGLLQRRAGPLERAWRQVLREAGARVVHQELLRDMDISLHSAEDGRRIDVVAYNLAVYGGVPLCGDATMVSPLHADGTPWRGAAGSNGMRLRAARRRIETVYPELVHSDRARLVLLLRGRGTVGSRNFKASVAPCKAPLRASPLTTAACSSLRLASKVAVPAERGGTVSIGSKPCSASCLADGSTR